MPDYEVLTLIISAVSYKKNNGPIHLYTDSRGYEWFNRKGLLFLYDDVHVILDSINPNINPEVFWAAGKVFAYSRCPAPCVSVDMDAIIWQKLPIYRDDAVALHPEPTNWGGYRNSDKFKLWGFEDWDWNTTAANVGVLIFNDQRLKDFYTDKSLEFMARYSNRGDFNLPYTGLFGPNVTTYVDEMIFAEQRLLMMSASKLDRTVGFIAGFDMEMEHVQTNPVVSHLWNSKRGYKVHQRAKETYCNYLLNHALTHYPEVFERLAKLKICACIVRDANVPVVRFSQAGEWALPGETIVRL